jgi:hypothetical protein
VQPAQTGGYLELLRGRENLRRRPALREVLRAVALRGHHKPHGLRRRRRRPPAGLRARTHTISIVRSASGRLHTEEATERENADRDPNQRAHTDSTDSTDSTASERERAESRGPRHFQMQAVRLPSTPTTPQPKTHTHTRTPHTRAAQKPSAPAYHAHSQRSRPPQHAHPEHRRHPLQVNVLTAHSATDYRMKINRSTSETVQVCQRPRHNLHISSIHRAFDNCDACICSDLFSAASDLGRILAEYVELTDKCSGLRGPPRDTVFFRIPQLILVWFWPRLWIES